MAKRFIRLMPNPDVHPGYRLRLERPEDESLTLLSEETVLPEKINDPDANHIESTDSIDMTESQIRWLYAKLGELVVEMDGNTASRIRVQAETYADSVAGIATGDRSALATLRAMLISAFHIGADAGYTAAKAEGREP